MFFTYLGRELRRRMRQASFAALGLAVGIGLVITVTAALAVALAIAGVCGSWRAARLRPAAALARVQ